MGTLRRTKVFTRVVHAIACSFRVVQYDDVTVLYRVSKFRPNGVLASGKAFTSRHIQKRSADWL